MKNHLQYRHISNPNSLTVNLGELNTLIRQDNKVDLKVIADFPVKYFGKLNDDLNMPGSKELIEIFHEINNANNKIDLLYDFKDIELSELNELNESMENISLNFSKDKIDAEGIYNFTHDFYELFEFSKYAKWLVKNKQKDLLKYNLENLLVIKKNLKKQFRLIEYKEKTYLRGFTSKSYKNYDNNLCIYLLLLKLHEYSNAKKVNYKIKNFHLSDSAFHIYFEKTKPISVKGVGDIYFGIVAINNEVRANQFSVEVRYTIVDHNDSDISFSIMPHLKDSVFEIKKTTNWENVMKKMESLNELEKIQQDMTSYIKGLKNIKVLSKSNLFPLFNKITKSKIIKQGTKNNFRDVYDKHLVKNTHTILQAMNKLKFITSDLEEIRLLERIYDEYIHELLNAE